jgi:hypothetical protein
LAPAKAEKLYTIETRAPILARIDIFSSSRMLVEEYVLVQAWKKPASYIRNHNWFSDARDVDMATVNLPRFLSNLRGALSKPSAWRNDDLRFVPAPKSQRWKIEADGLTWSPLEPAEIPSRIRPLAHVSLRDQVAATAVMLCFADRVETLHGDPRAEFTNEARTGVTSTRSVLADPFVPPPA